ncbi:MAG: ABC transporter ATP-binding protein [Microbacterium sp.]
MSVGVLSDRTDSAEPGAIAAGIPIRIDALARVFEDGTGLHPTTLAIEPSEFVSVLGPSGCGKSTLLRCLAGLDTPQAGSVRFGERTVFDASSGLDLAPRRRRIGMVFQDLALWPHLTAFENVAFPLRVTGRRDVRSAVDRSLELVGLERFAAKLPHQLSGGQQQRVAVARAVVARPDVLLLDEPFSALDAALKVQLRAELKTLVAQLGVTTVFVTHDQEEAMGLSDRIVVLSEGRVRQAARPETVYDSPADAFVADFIGAFNRLPDRTAPAGATPGALRGVRPERVEIRRPGDAGDGIPFDATVLDCTYRGGSYAVSVDVAGATEPWSVVSREAQRPGAHVALAVRPTDVISLDTP